ncbi:MAG: AbrB/MazE/SpoVT family DNA-binding domain-containing protein [Candidatus Desantisbacteria bacterium]
MNNLVTYGQTFSKGQLSIPKNIRDYYCLGENFAYKMTHQEDRIIIEPQEKKSKKGNLASALAKIKEPIYSQEDIDFIMRGRDDWDKRIKELGIE